jgi:hypothetical protein
MIRNPPDARREALRDLMKRHAAVVSAEADILGRWASDGGITAPRAARCRLTRRAVQDHGDRIAAVNQAIDDLPAGGVTSEPRAEHRNAATLREDALGQLSQAHGPTLPDPLFDEAIGLATTNARRCADNAEAAFADCTQP